MTDSVQHLDAIGIGIGPSNLSTAALLHPHSDFRCEFFERKPEFQWHPGQLFDDARIQVSFLKDVVTLVDPTSRFSFLAFLAASGRIYQFLTARFDGVLRKEFDQYYRWVSRQVETLHFGREVRRVYRNNRHFVVEVDGVPRTTQNLILGTGLVPRVPSCAQPHLGESVFHVSNYRRSPVEVTNKTVAVIGGGQSGAEIVLRLLEGLDGTPRKVLWYSKRGNFHALDDSPFANEFFTPSYSEYFRGLPESERRWLLEEQRFTSDGVSNDLLQRIYQRIYTNQFVGTEPSTSCRLRPGRRLAEIRPSSHGWLLGFVGERGPLREQVHADLVVLATGWQYQLPACMESLQADIQCDAHGLRLEKDFSLEWDGPRQLKIFVHNGGRLSRGIADPNLALISYRSARIINSLLGREVYRLGEKSPPVDWPVYEEPQASGAVAAAKNGDLLAANLQRRVGML